MPKSGISVTLDETNLLWLKSRTVATKGRSLSETLDALVTQARTGGAVPSAAIRSVVGSVDISLADPNLDGADDYMRSLFGASVGQPFLAREGPSGNRRAQSSVRSLRPKSKRRG